MGPERRQRFSWRLVPWLLVVLLTPPLTIRIMEGHAALLWTEYYVSRGPEKVSRSAENAAKAGRAAARAIDLVAPLPDAATAARLSLGLAAAVELQNPGTAWDVAHEVRSALDRARGSSFRGLGLSSLAEEARTLEERTQKEASGEPR
ncbi:MAG TPA: hypothetical protein VN083_11815 [Vicinamibacteria bacterium]|nr:hypothetical protein [Vicinamibacteria bacterium]